MTIQTKSQLVATINTLLPRPTDGKFDADKLNAFLQNVVDSSVLQRPEFIELTTNPVNLAQADIDENKVYYTSGMPRTVNLPLADATMTSRSTLILTLDEEVLTVVPAGGDTIVGSGVVKQAALVRFTVSAIGEWTTFAIPLSLERPNEPAAAAVDDNGATTALDEDVWTPISCNLTPVGTLTDFMVVSNTLVYTGTDPLEAYVAASISAQRGGGGGGEDIFEFVWALDGVNQSGIQAQGLGNDECENVVFFSIVTLNNGEVLQPRVQNVDDDNDLVADYISVSVARWG